MITPATAAAIFLSQSANGNDRPPHDNPFAPGGDPVTAGRLKPDHAAIRRQLGETRPPDRLIAHYDVERRLAARLRAAPRSERTHVYSEVYSELFESLPDHPQHTSSGETCGVRIVDRIRLLAPLLTPDSAYLEIGCGNAGLPIAIGKTVREVFGMDVTDALIDYESAPSNFRFVKTDGVGMPLPDCSIDLAHSDQLMEHLHIDDAEPQVEEIYRVLKPGGRYLCSTPNKVTGPHDISVYFDDTATGFHMKEYDCASLRDILLKAGFSNVSFPLVIRGFRPATLPYPMLHGIERIVKAAPGGVRRTRVVKAIMGITALATK
jgi:SAM-dependent methyltransferase